MKVIELVSENFKRLNATVRMDGKNVTVEGKNGVGKSSFIDAIWIALTGKDVPQEPIQSGKDSAKISVKVKSEDGSEFIVERSFTQKGASLIVRTEAGAKYQSPQKFLDEKIGKISFDPFDFVNKQPREQKKFLMDLLNLSFDDIDKEKTEALQRAQILKQENTNLVNSISSIVEHSEFTEERDTSEAVTKFNLINDKREKIKESKNIYESLLRESETIRVEAQRLRKDIEELEALHLEIDGKISEFGISPNFELPEALDIQKEIIYLQGHNEIVRQQKQRKELIEKKEKIEHLRNVNKLKIDDLEDERIKRISEAKMPIKNLSFSEDGVLFDGLPFTEEQLSHAKLIEIGIQIQMALNPALRIMRVKDGSLLDSETLQSIKNFAKENDYQVFIEKVNDNNEIGFVIEEE